MTQQIPQTTMSDQTPIEKAIEALKDAVDRIDNMVCAIDSGIHESELHDTAGDINDALAAIAAHVEAQRPGKVLAEAQYKILSDRMVEEHRKYGDKLRGGHWAEIAARKVVSHMADFAPVRPTLSVDNIMEVYHEHEQWFNLHGGTPAKRSGNFKARLNKLIG